MPQPAMPQPTHWPGYPQQMHTDPMWHMPQYVDPMMTPYYGGYPGYQMPTTQAPMFSDVSGSGDSAYRDENKANKVKIMKNKIDEWKETMETFVSFFFVLKKQD